MVMHSQASPHLLHTYDQERYRHVAQMIKLSSFLGSIVMTTAKPTAFVRDTILRSLNAIPITREFFIQGHMKPQPRYQSGFFLADDTKKAKALAGLLLPQPIVTTPQSQQVLLDDILGSDFALLRCYHNPSTAFASLKGDFWQDLNVRPICILPPNSNFPTETASPPGIPLTIVQSNDLNFLRSTSELFVVARPDRYILGAFREEKADTFVSAFQRKLQSQC
jgi:3-(3-hydroxy-phenyl)propionate hydroxylase